MTPRSHEGSLSAVVARTTLGPSELNDTFFSRSCSVDISSVFLSFSREGEGRKRMGEKAKREGDAVDFWRLRPVI